MTKEELNSLELAIETKFNKNQLLPRVKEEVLNINQVKELKDSLEPEQFNICVDSLTMITIYKRLNVSAIVGLVHKDREIKVILNCLKILEDKSLINFNNGVFIAKFILDSNTQNEIDKFCYPLPLVIPPKELKSNYESGYYLTNLSNNSTILNHHTKEDINLDVLNILNKVKLTLNENILTNYSCKWSSTNSQSLSLLKRYNKAIKQLSKIYLSSNKLYLTNKYDFRGRIYACGYYFNPQGNDFSKSFLELGNKEVLTD